MAFTQGTTMKEIQAAEHDSGSGIAVKKAGLYGYDAGAAEWVRVSVDATGAIDTQVTIASQVDDAAFTPGTSDGTTVMGLFGDAVPDSVDDGDAGAVRMSANRNMYVTIRDAAGNERGLNIDAAGAIAVTGGGGGTQYADGAVDPAPATGTAALGTDGANLQVLATDSSGNLQIDVLTAPITSVTNAGTFAVQEDGAALTALQLIDDPVSTISATPLMRVAVFDSSDSQITSFGGGTEYTEDVAAAGDPVGTSVNLVRLDTPTTITDTDGDNVAQRGTNYGAAYVQVVDSSGSYVDTFGGGTEYTEDAAAAGDPVGSVQILVRDDVPGTLVDTDGDNVARRGTNYGAAFSQIVTSSGSFVDSFGGGTEYTEDAAAAADPAGGAVILVRDDVLSGQTDTDGDNVAQRGTDKGEAYVKAVDTDALLTTIDADTGAILADTAAIQTAVELIDDTVATLGTTTYTEATSKGTIIGAVRNDTLATLADTDNEIAPLQVDADGALYVTGGTAYLEDDVTPATIEGGAIMAEVDAALTAITPIDGDWASLRLDANGALWTHDDALDAVIAGAELQVDIVTSALPTGAATETTLAGVALESGGNLATIAGAVTGSEMQADIVAALPTGTNAIGRVGHDISGMGDGVKTVASAGTDEALAGSTACKRVTIQAQTDNTGLIAVGATGVDATIATGTGIILNPGDSYELEIDNLATVFVDATVNGEGVRYTFFT